MILESLIKYYEARSSDFEDEIPLVGWRRENISYVIRLDKDGNLIEIVQLEKKSFIVPESPASAARSSNKKANFLCDNLKYFLGIDKQGKKTEEEFNLSKQLHKEVLKFDEKNEIAKAITSFFSKWEPKKAKEYFELHNKDLFEKLKTSKGDWFVFGVGSQYAHEDEKIKEAWNRYYKQPQKDEKEGICLATGEQTQIAKLHSPIKGINGANAKGASLVSFNKVAFESYGKKQSYNAPVGKYAEFAYSTALLDLINHKKECAFLFEDITVMFWGENAKKDYQQVFKFSIKSEDDNQHIIKSFFENLKLGKPIDINGIKMDPNQNFYILGFSPNNSRLSIRFFYKNSFGNILNNLHRHYKELSVDRHEKEPEFIGIYKLLRATFKPNQTTSTKVFDKNMVSSMFRAVVSGGNYPESLYSDVLLRIRKEKDVTYERAAIIKAYLMRNKKLLLEGDWVKLNNNSRDMAYTLGRMFAILEKIQKEAQGQGINSTIKDRYFNSACTTPAYIFPTLIRLKNSHIKKINEGLKINRENQLTELMDKIQEIELPKQLTLVEQGKFILGYYHQEKELYKKKEAVNNEQ